ncbi:MAG: diaminopimelate epimerase [Actinobacteria bacterium]|nr:diaminopimelate epimerase [Actinomycetota bacterium]
MSSLSFTKHHGIGNDFLVLLDLSSRYPIDAASARALCHRHYGVGADGVIRVVAGRQGAELEMLLRNADGSVAQTSGNGLRCMAQAAVEAGAVEPPSFTVLTAAGLQAVEYLPGGSPGWALVGVGMGKQEVASEERVEPLEGRSPWRARKVNTGNPHLVVLVPDGASLGEVDLNGLGARLCASVPEGQNVEFIAVVGPDRLAMRVWERGVGETLACGTGTCAAAAAAKAWGLAGERVVVDNPGGELQVDMSGSECVLTGLVRRVARVDVEWPLGELS